jgi:hypothetical protein
MAPGGAALWLSSVPSPGVSLPAGFEWTIAPPGDLRRLPERRFRLAIVTADADADPAALAAILDVGGVLVVADPPSFDGFALRLLDVDEDASRTAILRREA